MRYKEMLLRFIASDELSNMEVLKLERAHYIKMNEEITGLNRWIRYQKNFEITELGLKKLGGTDEASETK